MMERFLPGSVAAAEEIFRRTAKQYLLVRLYPWVIDVLFRKLSLNVSPVYVPFRNEYFQVDQERVSGKR